MRVYCFGFFMRSMLKIEKHSVYADVIERALYNTVLASFSTDGKSYFYVNPMEVDTKLNEHNPSRKHVKSVRQKWHPCACCPPNVARLLTSVSKYLYSTNKDAVYFHLYAASEASFELPGGKIVFNVETKYPLDGEIAVTIKTKSKSTLAFRIPGWCSDSSFKINGEPADFKEVNGYALISGDFNENDVISIHFCMNPRFVYANQEVNATAGKVCLMRGPVVYCLEECFNSFRLHSAVVDSAAEIQEVESTLDGKSFISLIASGFVESSSSNDVYSYEKSTRTKRVLTFSPYYLWGNHSPGGMTVWVREA